MSEIVGTGRHLDPLELRAWTGFLDASRMIDDVLGRHLVADHEMNHREYEVLVRLDGSGGRQRMSHLAQQIVASPALVTQTVARLERRGFVERQAASSGDGRGVDAVLLRPGSRALASAAIGHAELIRELLIGRIGADRLEAFGTAVHEVANHLRAHRRGEPCDDPDCLVVRYA